MADIGFHDLRHSCLSLLAQRGEPIREMKIVAVEHTTERIGCALAAITLLTEEDLL